MKRALLFLLILAACTPRPTQPAPPAQEALAPTLATHKPAAHAFRLWSWLVNEFPTLLTVPLPPDEEAGGPWVLTTRNEQGQIALLTATVTAGDLVWTPSPAKEPSAGPFPLSEVDSLASAFGIDAGAYTQEYAYFKAQMGFSNED